MYTYIALSDVSAACTRRITLWYECVRQCDIDRIYAHDMNASHSVNVIWMNAHSAHCLIQRDLSECRNALHVHVHRRRRSDSKQLRLPKYPTSFHGSPRTYETRFHGSPQIFKQVFTEVHGSARHSKEWTGNPSKYFKSHLLCEYMAHTCAMCVAFTRRITLWYECVRQCDIDRICIHDMNASHNVMRVDAADMIGLFCKRAL